MTLTNNNIKKISVQYEINAQLNNYCATDAIRKIYHSMALTKLWSYENSQKQKAFCSKPLQTLVSL